MPSKRDLRGARFSRLLVEKECADRDIHGNVRWVCTCDCGSVLIVTGRSLTTGGQKSCGCLRNEIASKTHKTHGKTVDGKVASEYNSWHSMKDRCNNPKAAGYEHYGGRGITYDLRWESFENFLEDMGVRPEGTTLDRINVNGNYEPGNCRWATDEVQARNKRIRKDSLYPGVTFNTSNNNWRVRMFYNKKNIEIGQFDTFLDAVCAKMNYENKFRNEVN